MGGVSYGDAITELFLTYVQWPTFLGCRVGSDLISRARNGDLFEIDYLITSL